MIGLTDNLFGHSPLFGTIDYDDESSIQINHICDIVGIYM